MNNMLVRAVSSAAVVLVLSLPLPAQRSAPEERGGGGGAAERGMSGGGGGATSRGISTGSFSTPSAPVGRPEGGNFGIPSNSRGGGVAYQPPAPNPVTSSFYSANSYWAWQSFLYHLQLSYMSRYAMDSLYLDRFIRNREPLVTPQMMKLALREPLTLSGRLVRSVEDLETMVADRQSGKTVSKDAIADKAHEIRELAKRIRQDQSLSYVDQRIDRDGKLDAADQLGLEAVAELRQLANDLHTQLKGMYTQSSTATVSVRNLSQPSFEALSKKIEKLSKVVETAAKRS